MDKILSYEQIQGFISEIRSIRNGYVSNFFWDQNKHPYWINKGNFYFLRKDECFLMIHQQDDFCNLFYIATCLERVTTALASVSLETKCVIDVVCRSDGEKEKMLFSNVGFSYYQHLFRMSHAGLLADDSWEIDSTVEFATNNDIGLLNDALERNFDPLSEQLPSLEEIKDYIDCKQVLVLKERDNLCGFIIFEVTGMTWYLRYWFTSSAYRNQGIGAKLLKSSLSLAKDTKRQILWVISENVNAIKRYEHFGFKRELLNDYVLIKERI